MAGTTAVSFGNIAAHTTKADAATSALNLAEAFRTAFNSARSEELRVRWCTPNVRLLAWDESADAGRDGPAGIDALLERWRGRFGRIVDPEVAGDERGGSFAGGAGERHDGHIDLAREHLHVA